MSSTYRPDVFIVKFCTFISACCSEQFVSSLSVSFLSKGVQLNVSLSLSAYLWVVGRKLIFCFPYFSISIALQKNNVSHSVTLCLFNTQKSICPELLLHLWWRNCLQLRKARTVCCGFSQGGKEGRKYSEWCQIFNTMFVTVHAPEHLKQGSGDEDR